jgi:hypothetical protein
MSGTGNQRLTDLGNILDLQLRATVGTYVADNEQLCLFAVSSDPMFVVRCEWDVHVSLQELRCAV